MTAQTLAQGGRIAGGQAGVQLGGDLVERLEELSLVESAELGIEEGDPQINISINRSTAAYYGVTAYQLANALSSSLDGISPEKPPRS